MTLTIGPSVISSVTVTYPTGWTKTTANDTPGPVTTYTTGDRFGLFAVDKNNKIVISNVPLTAPTTNSATQTITLPSGYLYSSQYTYYLMYPYSTSATGISALAVGATATYDASADTFFGDVKDGRTVQDNQSVKNTTTYPNVAEGSALRASDLQIAKYSSGFAMEHKMGLAVIGVTSKTSVYHTKYYLDNTYSWLHNKNTQNIKRSKTFTAYSAYPSNADEQYVVVKSNETSSPTIIVASNEYTLSDGTNGWSYTASNIAEGNCVNVPLPVPTMSCVNWTQYTLETGDVLFKDGALAKISSTYSTTDFPNRTPIALVTRTSTTSNDNGYGYKHGYALSLKEGNDGTPFDWGAVDGTHDQINPTGHSLTTPNVTGMTSEEIAAVDAEKVAEIEGDRDGLTYTRTVLARSDKEYYYAFIKANEYNSTLPVVKDNRITTDNDISEWFLGAIGQYIDASFEFGTVKNITPVVRDHADFRFAGQSKECSEAINAKFAEKIDDSTYYDELIRTGTGDYAGRKGICYFTSTVYDGTCYYYPLHWSFDGILDTDHHWITRDRRDYFSFGGAKMMKVRPMIAF